MSDDDIALQRGLLGLLDRLLRAFEMLALVSAGAVLLAAMVLVSLDALMRYAFNAPLVFQYTVTEEYLMVALVTLALSWGFRTGGYIRIMGVAQLLSRRWQVLLLRLGLLVSAVYMAFLGWTGGEQFVNTYLTGERRLGVIDWPVYWSWIWVPIGCGLLSLRVLLIAFGPASQLHVEHEPTEEI